MTKDDKHYRLFIFLSFLATGLYVPATHADEHHLSKQEKEIIERIKPVGQVYHQDDLKEIPGVGATTAVADAKSGPRSGEQIYKSACFACHGAGVLGAPKLQNAADWKPRLAKGFDTLLSHAINGFNAMPPRGTCADCTDDEIAAAIRFMTEGL